MFPLNFKPDPKFRYRWVNTENKVNLAKREAQGWEFVNPTTSDVEIHRRGDLVLMRMPEEKAREIEKVVKERYKAAYSSRASEYEHELDRVAETLGYSRGRLTVKPDEVKR